MARTKKIYIVTGLCLIGAIEIYFFKTGANNSLSLQVFALLERLNVKCALEDLDPVFISRERELETGNGQK
ncbi:hypothetical protein C2G38_2242705 [Gigaspora rosea]|uniref:Uncharacterized protein n=1 Tax=Gigaspora rosea TaxID=44941 RepID=A0A397VTS5_9GLOM|nr:hypothetical protein C2G38_2242705 [Gigaspora rosea]